MGDEGEGTGEGADAPTPDGEGTAEGEAGAGGPGWPVRPIVLVAGVVAGVLLIGGVALAARGGDSSPSSEASPETQPSERSTSTTTEPVETTTTTLAPTTTALPEPTVTEAAPTTARPPRSAPPATQAPPPPPPRSASCARPWMSGGSPQPTVVAPPGKFVSFPLPSTSCGDVADGCLVSVTLNWSDGYTEVGSMVLAEPGSYTVSGDRGLNWTFEVSGDRVCSSRGGSYATVYPPG